MKCDISLFLKIEKINLKFRKMEPELQKINKSLYRCCKGLLAAQNQQQLALSHLTKLIPQAYKSRQEFLESKEVFNAIERAVAPEILAETVWEQYTNNSSEFHICDTTVFIINTCREYWTNIIADHIYGENTSLSDITNEDVSENSVHNMDLMDEFISQSFFISENNTFTSATEEEPFSPNLLLSPSQWSYHTPSPQKENNDENEAKRQRIE